jgi:hypothetical protein
MIKETINHYYNKPNDKKREAGHYHASELWYIYKGYTTTGNFFKKDEVDKVGQANMFRGSAMEDMLAKVLTAEGVEFEGQQRYEIEVSEGIFISGKTDFEFPDKIIETKCPMELTNGIPPKWEMQMEFYHRASKKPVYLGIFDKNGSEIIRFFPYKPSDTLWETIKDTLIDFNRRLLLKIGKQCQKQQ